VFRSFLTSNRLQGSLILIIVTVLWGSTFVAIKGAIAQIDPLWVLLIRFSLAGLCFLPWLRFRPICLIAGLELGFWLILGYGTQTIGLLFTSASRSAFISALSVVMLALLMACSGQTINRILWISAFLALGGVGLLSYDGSTPNLGDFWSLGMALSYAIYLWRLEHYCQQEPSVSSLAAAQLWGATAIAGILVLLNPLQTSLDLSVEMIPWGTLIYLGLVTTALTTWLQTWGQQWVSALEAAIIFTLEPVWGALFAFLGLHEHLGIQGWVGAMLILGGTLLSQLPGTRELPELVEVEVPLNDSQLKV
jgi:drug/metabolite transporter (DMT)-like permease